MSRVLNKQLLGILFAFAGLAVVLFPSFSINAMGSADSDFFGKWQKDSEQLVVNEFSFTESGSREDFWGMGSIREQDDEVEWVGRKQQIGTQGHLFAFLNQELGVSSLSALRGISAGLTALVVSGLTVMLFLRKQPWLAGFVFLATLFSPWFVAAARNLYWVPWSLLLPALIAGFLSFRISSKWVAVVHLLLFLSFAFRFGTGYEFASSVVITASLMPFLTDFRETLRAPVLDSLRKHGRQGLLILLNSALAFMTVLLVHSFFRGSGSITSGLEEIYRRDVLRRTHGSPSDFSYNDRLVQSLEGGLFGSVPVYVFGWRTDLLAVSLFSDAPTGFGPNSLWILIALTVLLLVLYIGLGGRGVGGLVANFAAGLAIPLSWIILAKGHSVIHTHINYVLWYPFAVAIIFAVLVELGHRIFEMNRKRSRGHVLE